MGDTIQLIVDTKARHIVLKLLKEKKNTNLFFCWLFRNKITLPRISQLYPRLEMCVCVCVCVHTLNKLSQADLPLLLLLDLRYQVLLKHR